MNLRQSVIAAAVLGITVAACNRGPDVPTQTKKGVDFLSAGQFDSAIAVFDGLIAHDAKIADAYKFRGNAYRAKDEIDKAIADYNTAIGLVATDARYYNDRGFAYLRKGEYELAVQDFDKALSINPKHTLAMANRGRALVILGRFEPALTDLDTALLTDSTNTYLVIWAEVVRRRLNAGNEAKFKQQLHPTDSVAWPAPVAQYLLGKLTPDALLKAGEASVYTNPTGNQRCAAAFYIGEDLLVRHKTADATKYFEQTVASCPQRFSEHAAATGELKRMAH